MSEEQQQSVNEYRAQRIVNLRKLEELGFEPYGRAFERTRLSEVRAGFEEDKKVRAAGRLMTIRRMGKASFATISDGTANFQIFIKKDLLSETLFEGFKHLDLGDFIGVEGRLFTTARASRPLKCIHGVSWARRFYSRRRSSTACRMSRNATASGIWI